MTNVVQLRKQPVLALLEELTTMLASSEPTKDKPDDTYPTKAIIITANDDFSCLDYYISNDVGQIEAVGALEAVKQVVLVEGLEG